MEEFAYQKIDKYSFFSISSWLTNLRSRFGGSDLMEVFVQQLAGKFIEMQLHP